MKINLWQKIYRIYSQRGDFRGGEQVIDDDKKEGRRDQEI